jgi:hypothetical protein
VIGHRHIRELADHRDQVLVLAPTLERCPGGDGPERLAGYPRREVDVVGGEILDHADVGNARRERPLPPRGHLVHLAELACLEAGTKAPQRRVVPFDVTDRAGQAPHLERLGEPRSAGQIRRQRFLHENRDARLGQAHSDHLVVASWHGQDAIVHAGEDQRLNGVHNRAAAGHPAGVTLRVGGTHQLDPIQVGKHPGMVTAHHAQPD